MNIIDGLLKHQVLFVEKALKRDLPDILASPVPGTHDKWGHTNYRHVAYTLAYLYRFDHPDNPFHGDAWVRETAVQLVDTFVDAWLAERDVRDRLGETEWPPYALCYVTDVLSDHLDDQRLGRWRQYIEDYIAAKLAEPAFFTSPNHEMWRFATMYKAGRTFDRPDWCETAVAMCRQLLHWQTKEGFWEEGVHHGPSMKYNHKCMAPIGWLQRETGDETIREAARRLAEFMVRYTFPDGTTVGCFDGRQSMSPGYFAPASPGLELAPGGLTLIRRMLDHRQRLGMLDDVRALGSSIWYAYFDILHVSDACRYFEEIGNGDRLRSEAKVPAPVSEHDQPLPLDADGAVVANHTTTFDGVAGARGPWVIALSGQESDIPKIGAWVYRLERQSRISLWHEAVGVVLGGGHNITGQAAPLANVVVTTGYGPTVEHGRLTGDDHGDVRSQYICRAAETDWADGVGRLTVHFLHGEVAFEVEPIDNRSAEVRFTWLMRGVERLAVQAPVVVWRGARIALPGHKIEPPPSIVPSETDGPTAALKIGGVTLIDGPVRVEHDALGYAFEVTPPGLGMAYARFPLEPIRSYGKLFDDERFDSPYHICLLGTQIDAPERTGSGTFTVRFEP